MVVIDGRPAMESKNIIAIDAMGGDKGPTSAIAGADIAKERFPGVESRADAVHKLLSDSGTFRRLDTEVSRQDILGIITAIGGWGALWELIKDRLDEHGNLEDYKDGQGQVGHAEPVQALRLG